MAQIHGLNQKGPIHGSNQSLICSVQDGIMVYDNNLTLLWLVES